LREVAEFALFKRAKHPLTPCQSGVTENNLLNLKELCVLRAVARANLAIAALALPAAAHHTMTGSRFTGV